MANCFLYCLHLCLCLRLDDSVQVAENSPAGTVVATLTTLDPDNAVNPHQNFTYRLLNDANGRFRVDGDRLLVSEVAGACLSAHCSLNHEVLPDLLLEASAQPGVLVVITELSKD